MAEPEKYSNNITIIFLNTVITLLQDTITLSEHQIRKFFKLKDESGLELKNTFRPAELSGRNGREITFADLDHKCDYDQAFKWHSSPACEIATRYY